MPAMAIPSPDPSPDLTLLRSLLRLSRDISLFDPPSSLLQRRSISSLARKSKLLFLLFEELLRRDSIPDLPRTATLCLKEILVLLRRSMALLEICSTRMSRMRLLLQAETVSNDLRELTHDLSILLDIFPLADLHLTDDVSDLVLLLRNQCRKPAPPADPKEENLRSEVLETVCEIERGIVPDLPRLEKIFQKLGLSDSKSFGEEIERLENEIRERTAGKWTAGLMDLLGLVRYAKCVLFGASTPRPCSAASDSVVPADFRCPISLDLMTDPVVVASGQTYDRESISQWIESGHATCPKSGQALSHLHLVSNRALKSLISQWCRNQNVPFAVTVASSTAVEPDGVNGNKAATEAARMTALFLVQKLAVSPSPEKAIRIVHELRQLAKSGSENRAYIAEAGAIALLLPLLGSEDPSLQVNAVTALLNLSILQANKQRIMQAAGGFDGIIHVLRNGATWQAMENAAATLLSLSSLHALYRRKVGKDPRVVEGLVELVRAGPASSKRDGLVTILSLAGDRANVTVLTAGGVVEAALEVLGDAEVAGIAMAVLAAVAKSGGAWAVAAAEGSVAKMVGVLRQGSSQARESAAATLVSVCRQGGGGAVAELAMTSGIECVFWELMGSGSARLRRKAVLLGKMCRRLAASEEEQQPAIRFHTLSITAASMAVAQT